MNLNLNLTAKKKAAIAEAKLKAIEQAIEEEGKEEQDTLTTIPDLYEPVDTKQQTQAWVNTQRVQEPRDCMTENLKHEPEKREITHMYSTPKSGQENPPLCGFQRTNPFAPTPIKDFAAMVQEQARLKNHPNVLASVQPNNQKQRTRDNRLCPPHTSEMELEANRRVFKSNMENRNAPRREAEEEKYCLFHQRKGHLLNECKAFEKESLEAKDEFVRKVGLCFHCLLQGHRSIECSAVLKCAKCGDGRHPTVLHKEKPEATRREHGEELQTACTAVCRDPHSVGVSCSKIVLVDIFNENRAQEPYGVYAVLEDQSNASMISPNLADKLGATRPSLKYLLSTCSGGKEEKSGRRVSGVILRSMAGRRSRLPQLVECTNIPQDKREIITPEMARQFPHLREIVEEILANDHRAKVEILIGRDAPELLKIRESRNGPKEAPWAQRLRVDSVQSNMSRSSGRSRSHFHTSHSSRISRLNTQFFLEQPRYTLQFRGARNRTMS